MIKYDQFLKDVLPYKEFNYKDTTTGASYQIQKSGHYKYHHDPNIHVFL